MSCLQHFQLQYVLCTCCVFQADIEPPVVRPPIKPLKPAPPPPVSPRTPPRPPADVHIVSDQAGTDTIRQSFEPPPPITHVVSDTAGSQTIRESFEPPHVPLSHVINDNQPQQVSPWQLTPSLWQLLRCVKVRSDRMRCGLLRYAAKTTHHATRCRTATHRNASGVNAPLLLLVGSWTFAAAASPHLKVWLTYWYLHFS